MFEKSRLKAYNKFNQRLISLVKESGSSNVSDTHVIFIDKNHPVEVVDRVVAMIDENIDSDIALKKVFLIPKITQVQDRLAGLPFDVSFYLQCFSRALKRKNHPTMNVNDPYKLIEILSHFVKQLRYVHFDERFLAEHKLDDFLEVPMADNEIDVPPTLISSFY